MQQRVRQLEQQIEEERRKFEEELKKTRQEEAAEKEEEEEEEVRTRKEFENSLHDEMKEESDALRVKNIKGYHILSRVKRISKE